ncbi:hypothetical protein EKE94_06610 [Mesobaculum littorinae]|uniref:Uncharacterized protein n=1 Tax=Mesobaculum littorinae TaxID=2486419 RepID=A0A438AIJ7_9RHOB|nr:hypothetical protein [Mesobaculum littorinae]RVV98581.1 hypothetical protein EKE94_06610 [Mesobaculum littorinae]
MRQRFEVSTASIRYQGGTAFSFAPRAEGLTPSLEDAGFDFSIIGMIGENEIQYISPELILTIGRDDDDPRILIVTAESPVDVANPRQTARDRFTLCSLAVRHFVAGLAAEEVIWHHKGGRYLTAPGREIEIQRKPVRRAQVTGDTAVAKAARRAAAHAADVGAVATDAHTDDAGAPSAPIALTPERRRRAMAEADLRRDATAARRRARDRLMEASPVEPANDYEPDEAATIRALRASQADLAEDRRQELNLPTKLTIYTMNSTLCIMAFPVGAGLLTYNLLRGNGGSVRATASAIALTGVALTILGQPMGADLTAALL